MVLSCAGHLKVTMGAVSSLVHWLCHVQKTLFHKVLLVLSIFLAVPFSVMFHEPCREACGVEAHLGPSTLWTHILYTLTSYGFYIILCSLQKKLQKMETKNFADL